MTNVQGMQNNPMQMLQGIASMMKGNDPQKVAMNLMQRNPQFAQFMQSVKGKTPEQFAQEHGIDFKQIMGMLK